METIDLRPGGCGLAPQPRVRRLLDPRRKDETGLDSVAPEWPRGVGREFHVLDLVGGASPAGGLALPGDTGDVVDDEARRAYQRRLSEVEDEIDDAAPVDWEL